MPIHAINHHHIAQIKVQSIVSLQSNKFESCPTVKRAFKKETYMDHAKVNKNGTNPTKLRISAQRLEIEVG